MPEEAPRAERDANKLIVQFALTLCAIALPVVGLNMFASSLQSEGLDMLALALTATFAVMASAFILWGSKTIAAQSQSGERWHPGAEIRPLPLGPRRGRR